MRDDRQRVDTFTVDQNVQSNQGGASSPSPQNGANDVVDQPTSKGSGSGSIRRISTAGSEQVNDSQ